MPGGIHHSQHEAGDAAGHRRGGMVAVIVPNMAAARAPLPSASAFPMPATANSGRPAVSVPS